jgi:N-acetylglucosaminyldiphosphoundecaprenol N-acetyl-beta-D-mannosaminyltransferase
MSNVVANSGTSGVCLDATGTRCIREETRRLGPIHYSPGTISDFEKSICAWLAEDHKATFLAGYVNPHVFNIAWTNPSVRECLAQSDITAVDGLGVAVAVSLITRTMQTRTVMTPLFDRVLSRNSNHAEAILIGGSEEVVSKGAQSINNASHGLKVTVTAGGYEPIQTYISLIEAHPECDVILAAMGSPRSEELILTASQRFSGKLFWNIGGGTLHFYAGTQRRTPPFVSAIGLQWLWRIILQPSIAPRYVIGTPLYLGRLIATLARPQKFNS